MLDLVIRGATVYDGSGAPARVQGLGNCAFGIAPCPPRLRETMLKNLSVVECMDLDALVAGARWEFEGFAEYLAALERIRPYANVGVLAGHSSLRIAVMGRRLSGARSPLLNSCGRCSLAGRSARPGRGGLRLVLLAQQQRLGGALRAA